MKHYLFFDTETSGLPKSMKAPLGDLDNWCRVVQLAWSLTNENFEVIEQKKFYIEAKDFEIDKGAEDTHGISKEKTLLEGVKPSYALEQFAEAFSYSNILLVAHNINFDFKVIASELLRNKQRIALRLFLKLDTYCTMLNTVELCKIPFKKMFNKFKYPKLAEAYKILLNKDLINAHDAFADVKACKELYIFLKERQEVNVKEV